MTDHVTNLIYDIALLNTEILIIVNNLTPDSQPGRRRAGGVRPAPACSTHSVSHTTYAGHRTCRIVCTRGAQYTDSRAKAMHRPIVVSALPRQKLTQGLRNLAHAMTKI